MKYGDKTVSIMLHTQNKCIHTYMHIHTHAQGYKHTHLLHAHLLSACKQTLIDICMNIY